MPQFKPNEPLSLFPHDADHVKASVIVGVCYCDGINDVYYPVNVNSDGKIAVDTEITIDGLTIENLYVDMNRSIDITLATGAAAINTTTALSKDFRLDHISCHWDAATSDNMTVSLDSGDGAAYDVVLQNITISNVTDVTWTPDSDMLFKSGDEIKISQLNSGAATYGLKIVTEVI